MFDVLVIALVLFFRPLFPPQLWLFVVIIFFVRIFSFLVFSITYLHFIGEDFRYLYYNAFPTAVILTYLLVTTQRGIVWGLFCLIAILSIVSVLVWQRGCKKNKLYYISQNIVTSLKKIDGFQPRSMLVVPYTLGKPVAYLTKKRTFLTISPYYLHRIRDIYWNNIPLEIFVKKNKISHVLVFKDTEKGRLFKWHKILDTDEFTLYKV